METRIREARIEKKMTQQELAETSGVARSMLSQLETGRRTIVTSTTMVKIAKALEKPVEDIFLF